MTKAFYIDSKGELSLSGGHVDVCGEQIIYAYLSLLNYLRKKMLLFILRSGRPPPLGQILGHIPCRRSHFLMKQNVSASSSMQTHASPAGGPVPTQSGKKKSLLWQQNALRMSAFPNLKRFQDGPRLKGLSCGRIDNSLWHAKQSGTLGVEEKPQLTDTQQEYPRRLRWELEEV